MKKRDREESELDAEETASKAPKLSGASSALQDARARIEALKAQLKLKREESDAIYTSIGAQWDSKYDISIQLHKIDVSQLQT